MKLRVQLFIASFPRSSRFALKSCPHTPFYGELWRSRPILLASSSVSFQLSIWIIEKAALIIEKTVNVSVMDEWYGDGRAGAGWRRRRRWRQLSPHPPLLSPSLPPSLHPHFNISVSVCVFFWMHSKSANTTDYYRFPAWNVNL